MFPMGVATLGSFPVEEDEFDNFLEGLGITFHATSPDMNVLVVGQRDWEDHLKKAIESRRGNQLRVYSQEMFLALLRAGRDPLESPTVAILFGKGHPALEYIQEWGFDWPTTRIVPYSRRVIVTQKLRDNSPLTILGYKVGKTGKGKKERLKSLIATLHTDFNLNPRLAEFLPDWGEPGSGTRLQKMAKYISMNIYPRSAGGRRQEAVRDWLEDLQWLKTTFYDDKHTFKWPVSRVD